MARAENESSPLWQRFAICRRTPTMMSSGASTSRTTLLVAIAIAAISICLQDAIVATEIRHLPRLATDFSPTYLQREIASLSGARNETLVFGDSILWGFGVAPAETAIAVLRERGIACENLAFKNSSPPNYYALLRIVRASGITPAALVLEVNAKVLNPEDDAFESLNPSVASLARPLLDRSELAELRLPQVPREPAATLDRLLGKVWLTYAMRADIRESVSGETDVPRSHRPKPEDYEGTYDLTPLDERNIGLKYLEKTVDLARASSIPTLAFMTPIDHVLLHDYVDSPEYRSNHDYVVRALRKRGAEVLDLDAAFPEREFIDEAHLTPPGQRRLAADLSAALHSLRLSGARPAARRRS